ncbi:hypothetical protein BDW71DRAFT_175370 [Aspergillus fruticulosus]
MSYPISGVYAALLASLTGYSEIEENQDHGLMDAALKNSAKLFVSSFADSGGEASTNGPALVPYFIIEQSEHHLINTPKDTDMDDPPPCCLPRRRTRIRLPEGIG